MVLGTMAINRGGKAISETADTDKEWLSVTAMIEEMTSETLTYSTTNIVERRRRMLEVVLELIVEKGHAGFSVREFCTRASVSAFTLYKAFGSKERLVAVAIGSRNRLMQQLDSGDLPAESLDGVVQRLILNDRRMIADKSLSNAMISIHYSGSMDENLWRVIRESGDQIFKPWVKAAHARGELREGLDPKHVTEQLSSLILSVGWEWYRETIHDDEFIFSKLETVLLYAHGATLGDTRGEVAAMLDDILGSRRHFNALAAPKSNETVAVG